MSPPVRAKECATCGDAFEPASNRQKFCKVCGCRPRATCVQCGKEFRRQANTSGRYCSSECWYASATRPEMRRRGCAVCGEEFKPLTEAQKTCSRRCAAVVRTTAPKVCPVCGSEFKSNNPAQKTCSRECGYTIRGTRIPEQRCERCGKVIIKGYRGQRFCSHQCRTRPLGSKRHIHGYVQIRVGRGHPGADSQGWIFEHREVLARHIGRPLEKHETVHHKNGDRTDNHIENLELRVGRHGKGASHAHCPTCTCFH
jgi:hypothetical protein